MEDPWARAARGRVVADHGAGRRGPRDHRRLRAGHPGVARRAWPAAARADRRAQRRRRVPTAGVGSTWSRTAGSGIKSRETYEAPAAPGPDHGPRRPGEHLPRARPVPREAAARGPLRRPGLRRAVVLAAQGGLRRVHRREPAVRDRRGAPAARTRSLLRGRAPQPALASTTTAWPPTRRPTPSTTRTPRASSGCGASACRPGRPSRARAGPRPIVGPRRRRRGRR